MIFSRVNKHRPLPFIPLVLMSVHQLLDGLSAQKAGQAAAIALPEPAVAAAPLPDTPVSTFPGLKVGLTRLFVFF